jgi:hypothetical protein
MSQPNTSTVLTSRGRSLRRCLLSALCMGVCVGAVPAQSSDELGRRFLEEAPPSWEKYAIAVQRLSGTVDESDTNSKWGPSRTITEVKHNSACQLCLVRSESKDGASEEVLAHNRAYAFFLRRKTSEKPWVITSVVNLKQDAADSALRRIQEAQLPVVGQLTQLYNRGLEKLVLHKTFRVLSARPVNLNEEELVEIQFDNTHPLSKDTSEFFPVQSGVLVLDPKKSWCLRSGTLQNKYFGSVSSDVLATEIGGLLSSTYPIPARLTLTMQTLKDNGETIQGTMEFKFDLREPTSLPPDEEFTLTAFGLPEPAGLQAIVPPTRWYLWAGLAGILCLAAGVIVTKLRRKSA